MSVLSRLPEWTHCCKLWKADLTSQNSKEMVKPLLPPPERREAVPEDANCISSLVYKDEEVEIHYPLLDIDMSAALIPSRTAGHYHLYIDKQLSREDYQKLLTVLEEVGIINTGVLNQFDREGVTFLRLPGVET
jgi:hypothetical protein